MIDGTRLSNDHRRPHNFSSQYMKYSIQIAFKDDENKERHSAVVVDAENVSEAYSMARQQYESLNKVRFGSCIRGDGVIV